jgi:thiol-disulfide isomerase/thioredoxin
MGKMINWLVVTLLIVGGFRYAQTYIANGDLEGKQFNDFKIVNLDGNQSTFQSSFKGPIIVAFWSVGCLPCRIELSRFQSAIENNEIDTENFVAVNVGDSQSDIIRYMKKQKWDFDCVMDYKQEGFRLLNLKAVPTVFHLKRGFIVNSVLGGISPLGIIRGQKFIIDFSK